MDRSSFRHSFIRHHWHLKVRVSRLPEEKEEKTEEEEEPGTEDVDDDDLDGVQE